MELVGFVYVMEIDRYLCRRISVIRKFSDNSLIRSPLQAVYSINHSISRQAGPQNSLEIYHHGAWNGLPAILCFLGWTDPVLQFDKLNI